MIPLPPVDALGPRTGPPEAPDASEVAWLPASPSGGILERSRRYPEGVHGGDVATLDDWWHEERRNACRAYIGTVLNWRPGGVSGGGPVTALDLNSDIHRMLLADIRANAPWTDVLALYGALAVGTAGARFGATAVREELYACLALGERWEDVDKVVENVHFCRRRDERAKFAQRMLGVAHSPDEVAALCAAMLDVS